MTEQIHLSKADSALQGLLALDQYVRQHKYAGFDPYDALNGALVRALTLGSKFGRIAWIQLFRRLPVNLRPLLGVRKGENPKGLGLFLWSYARLHTIDAERWSGNDISYLLDRLAALRSPNCTGNGWGYNFDWQNRVFYIPKHTPTIVNSSFIGHGLIEAFERTGNHRALDLAIPIADFLLNDLHRTPSGNGFCFSYTPLDQTRVHNANLLGASFLVRLLNYTQDAAHRDAALEALAYTMGHQNADGSWYYGEAPEQRWIDSFHTGFNLQATRFFLESGNGEAWTEQYNLGRDYYVSRFFLKDGTPRYYHDRTFPIDIHCPAQAIAYLSGEGSRYAQLVDKVLGWTLANMRHRAGFFGFRRGRWLRNNVPYMRWSQAWMMHALSAYLDNASQDRLLPNTASR